MSEIRTECGHGRSVPMRLLEEGECPICKVANLVDRIAALEAAIREKDAILREIESVNPNTALGADAAVWWCQAKAIEAIAATPSDLAKREDERQKAERMAIEFIDEQIEACEWYREDARVRHQNSSKTKDQERLEKIVALLRPFAGGKA